MKVVKILSTAFFFCLMVNGMSAQSDDEGTRSSTVNNQESAQQYSSDGVQKTKISKSELPDEAIKDITINYNGAEIQQVYKVTENGKFRGYLVEAKKAKKVWDVRFDKNGNPMNKRNAN